MVKRYEETHQQGMISFEQSIERGVIYGDIGIQVAEDGRIWVCVDQLALIRFKPMKGDYYNDLKSTQNRTNERIGNDNKEQNQ